MKKRILAVVLSMALAAACLTACGEDNKQEKDKAETTTTTEATTTTTTTEAATTTTTSKTTTTSDNAATVTTKKNTTAHEVIVPTDPGQTTTEGYWHTESTTTKATTTTTKATTKATTKKQTAQVAGYLTYGNQKYALKNVSGFSKWKFTTQDWNGVSSTTAELMQEKYSCTIILMPETEALSRFDRECVTPMTVCSNAIPYKGGELRKVLGGTGYKVMTPTTYYRCFYKLKSGYWLWINIEPGGKYAQKRCKNGEHPTTYAYEHPDEFSSVFANGDAEFLKILDGIT